MPGLIEALKDDKAAYWALIILRDIGPAAKEAVPAITEKLKDKKPEIRREAALTLGAMGEAAAPAVPQIAALLSDEHAAAAATFVLGKLGQISKEAEENDPRQRQEQRPDAEHDEPLGLGPRSSGRQGTADQERPRSLVARLKDKDQFVRVAAARALAALAACPGNHGARSGKRP